jgi:hypothetical protein
MESLRDRIRSIKEHLQELETKLFNMRLAVMCNNSQITEKDEILTASQFSYIVDVTDCKNWEITYISNVEFDINNYNFDDASETETDIRKREFEITFGCYNSKYYIAGNRAVKYEIYRTAEDKIRILNKKYDEERDLEMEEQDELIKRYSETPSIPEWLALKVFLFMNENDWDDAAICRYFSVV